VAELLGIGREADAIDRAPGARFDPAGAAEFSEDPLEQAAIVSAIRADGQK